MFTSLKIKHIDIGPVSWYIYSQTKNEYSGLLMTLNCVTFQYCEKQLGRFLPLRRFKKKNRKIRVLTEKFTGIFYHRTDILTLLGSHGG